VKRLFDIFFSILGLVVLSPLFLVVSVWIKLDSRGPVFYRQLRVGRHNRDFRIFKFRSMRTDADKAGPITVGGHDPRITRSGYLIRKYKLDELPQLINVLIGDMSFVGPRPDVPGYADRLTGEDRDILLLRPGITGPASLKYRDEENLLALQENPQEYNDTVIYPDKVRINLYYLRHYSFAIDIKIIFCTIFGKKMKYNGETV
jgi:lipopolysaccharide/colanic/teichoic acid biosynthesis glycosyltransferase